MTMAVALKVVIVGAGIAGLSAAISLRRAGHRVRIYERSALSNEVGAAIAMPPNASRPLLAWVVDPAASRFVTAQYIMTGVGTTREQLNSTPPWRLGRPSLRAACFSLPIA
jgi:salicylate hydroxylase